MSNYLIILDRAHGKDTAGKRSLPLPDNVVYREWAMSDDVVCNLMQLCKKHGIEAVDLVPEDIDIHLRERVNRANKIASKSDKTCLLFSIHSNAARGDTWSTAHGWEAYTSKGETNSDKVAEILYEEAAKMWGKKAMRSDFTDGDSDKEAQFYMLRKTSMPAILSENFFHTNLEETKKLLTDAFRRKIAMVHFNCILQLEETKPF